MRATPRLVLLFGLGVPVSLALILADERLWTFGVVYLALVITLAGLDGLRMLPARALELRVEPPDTLYIGADDRLAVTVSAAGGIDEWKEKELESTAGRVWHILKSGGKGGIHGAIGMGGWMLGRGGYRMGLDKLSGGAKSALVGPQLDVAQALGRLLPQFGEDTALNDAEQTEAITFDERIL